MAFTVVTPVEPRFYRYNVEFIGRVVYATWPAVIIVAATGGAWLWRSGHGGPDRVGLAGRRRRVDGRAQLVELDRLIGGAMHGLMMEMPLSIPLLLRRTESLFGHKTLVTRRADRSLERRTYGDVLRRARGLAAGLAGLGIKPGDRVATFCWNHSRHLEAYYGVPASGAVLHTLNIRLHPEELAYIITHAGDAAVIVDKVLWPAFAQVLPRLGDIRVIVISDDGDLPPGTIDYEQLVASATPSMTLADVDERAGALMCYTSGTTGRSKGVLYSHRSMVLHALTLALPDCLNLREADVVLAVVPMFHVNAWGLPFACAMLGSRAGAARPAPGRGQHRRALRIRARHAGGRRPHDLARRAQVPRRAPGSRPVVDSLDDRRRRGDPRVDDSRLRRAARAAHRARLGHDRDQPGRDDQPRPVRARVAPHPTSSTPGGRCRAGPRRWWRFARAPTTGLAPWDGVTMGELEVRGPWVASAYFPGDVATDRWTEDGWFKTGDIATIAPSGCVTIQDRAKDLVKSGGEWISTVALESALVSHPAVSEAVVVAVPHAQWGERPLAVIVAAEGCAPTIDDLRAHLAPHFAKWWLPDAVVCVERLPKTATGKYQKHEVRAMFAGHYAQPPMAS